MVCPKCNNETTNEALFCSKCGIRINGEETDVINENEKLLSVIAPIVRSTLKAPLTAIFCPPNELIVSNKYDNIYDVKGYVNSQNSYGALIKTAFNIQVKLIDGEWEVINTVMENQVAQNLGCSLIWGIVITVILFFIFYSIIKSATGI